MMRFRGPTIWAGLGRNERNSMVAKNDSGHRPEVKIENIVLRKVQFTKFPETSVAPNK